MKAALGFLTIVGTLVALSACATASRINDVDLGMTKREVVQLVGQPTSMSAQGRVEYFTYSLYDTAGERRWGRSTPYFVRFIDGKVESYGRKGDFGTAAPAAQTINVNVTQKTDKSANAD